MTKMQDQIWISLGIENCIREIHQTSFRKETIDIALSNVCRYVEACSGVIYLLKENTKELNLISTHAMLDNQKIHKTIKVGQGSMGQVALDRKPIILTDGKQTRTIMVNGVVQDQNFSILTYPLLHKNNLIGVMELVMYREAHSYKLEFIGRISEIIAGYVEKYSLFENQVEPNNKKYNKISAEELQKDDTELYSLIAHQLKNPLNSILVLSEMLFKNCNNSFSMKEVKQLKMINLAGKNLLNLIDQNFEKVRSEAVQVINKSRAGESQENDIEIEKSIERNNTIKWESQNSLHNKKIMLVDDDVNNLFTLSSVLEAQGAKTLQVNSGIRSVELLRKQPVDLILMDILMPGMDGYSTIKSIRNMAEGNKVPIIAITAQNKIGNSQKCIEAGANDYISKPIDYSLLVRLIKSWSHTTAR